MPLVGIELRTAVYELHKRVYVLDRAVIRIKAIRRNIEIVYKSTTNLPVTLKKMF
jgi:hypothetical protein